MESSLRIVAITNCPAGIAHTYMVAEALEAYKHRSERGAKRSKEPLKAFVLTGKGLESWWR